MNFSLPVQIVWSSWDKWFKLNKMSVSAAADGQCHYFLTKKRRYCRFQPKEGQQYCPEHACMMGIHGKRKRIPCPLNPRHNCYEDEVDKHIKKCNVTKNQKATQEARYYVRGINKAPTPSEPQELSLENKKVCVKDLTSEELAALIARVDQLYQDHVDHIETAVLEHPCVKAEYCECEDNDLVKALQDQAALRKELLQQASLIGQLQQLGFLSGGHCFVEMGAGKGKLSHWIQKASKNLANNSYLLIDRSSVRYKMDSFHKQGGAESEFKRIKVDIEDLCLGLVDLVESSKSVVVVGKHLCGGATDMGIRCAVETLRVPETCQHLLSSAKSYELVSANLNRRNLQENGPQAEGDEPQRVLELFQHSPLAESNSNKQLLVDLNSEQIQHNDNQTEKEEPALSGKPSSLDIINERHTTLEGDSKVRAFGENGLGVTGSSSSHSPQSCLENHQHISNHTTDTHKKQDILCGDAQTYRGDKLVDSKRKENGCLDLSNEQEPPAKSLKLVDGEIKHKLPKGIMIALCCHHRCTWDTYIGQEFMTSCGVSPQEFDLLTRLSSWATCAKVTAKSTRSKNSERISSKVKSEQDNLTSQIDQNLIVGANMKAEDHATDDLMHLDASKTLREQLSISEREEIGRKCKRIIDTGRLHYLRSKGLMCFMRQYIDEELTPENVVLIAHIPDS